MPTGENTCLSGMTGFAKMTGVLTLEDQEYFAKHFCDYGAEHGLYAQGDATWSDLAPKLRAYHELLNPHCVHFGNAYFDQMPESLRADVSVEINSAEWGRRFCLGYFDDQYFAPDGTFSESGTSRYIGDHLSLLTPIVVAKILQSYNRDMGISREEFRRVARETVDRAVQSGVIRAAADPPFFQIDQVGLQLLLRQALQN